MNCRQFQNRLHEYVEGSLPAPAQAAADAHRAGCPECQREIEREKRVAQYLSNRIKLGAARLELRAEFRQRILAASRAEMKRPAANPWKWLAWPVGIAAAAMVISSVLFFKRPPAAPPAISVQVSYRVPTVEFRRQGNLLIDAVSYQTVVASETLRPDKP